MLEGCWDLIPAWPLGTLSAKNALQEESMPSVVPTHPPTRAQMLLWQPLCLRLLVPQATEQLPLAER